METFLAIWGAVLATGLAGLEIRGRLQERARLRIDARLLERMCDANGPTHGVRIEVPGPHVTLHREIVVEIEVQNRGSKPTQVFALFVDDGMNVTQVFPEGFPTMVEPATSVRAVVQPEVMAPFIPEVRRSKVTSEIRWGVFDGVGRKHLIAIAKVRALLAELRKLPLRHFPVTHKESGDEAVATHMLERVRVIDRTGTVKALD